MSVSFSCHCPERRKPIAERNWGVYQRYCNFSAFSGYHQTPSDYSGVVCLSCRATGRTKAAFVSALPDITMKDGDWQYVTPQPKRTKTNYETDHSQRTR
jgi:hypothetical protein